MALGTTTRVESVAGVGPVFYDRVTVVGDGAYPTGGSAGLLAAFRVACGAGRNIFSVIPQDCGGYSVAYDHVNDKLIVRHGDNDGVADGPSVEVPNATNLAAVTLNLCIISY